MSNITYDIIERKIDEAIDQVKIVTQPTGLPIHLRGYLIDPSGTYTS